MRAFTLNKSLLALGTSVMFAGCSNSGTSSSSTASPESALLTAANTSINTVGTSSSGVLSGTGSTSTSSHLSTMALPSSFSTDAICSHSGDVNTTAFANNDTTGWAIARVYCNFAKRPDGPDTVRGGLDRTAGLMCAVGNNLTYDGTAHSVTITFDGTCFSPAFLAIACGGAASCSGTASVTAYTATQYATAGYTAPTGFNKIIALTVMRGSSGLYNTIAISDSSATEKAIAINYALPDGSHSQSSVIAVYMNSGTGVIRYEGRFAGNPSDYDFRHLRAQITGTVDASTFALSNITNLQFIEGDNFETVSSSAFYLSLSGSTAGRVIGYGTNAYSSGWGSWDTSGNPDNGACYPSDGTCSAPLAPTSSDTTFITQGDNAATWFSSASLLNSASSTVPVTDLWP